jgi:hypothetical protein
MRQIIRILVISEILLTACGSGGATTATAQNAVSPSPSPTSSPNCIDSFSGGSGTSSDPYLISTAADLANINNCLSLYYRLTVDLDLSSATLSPIGSTSNPFSGTFDGNSKTLSSWTLAGSGNNVGLFSSVTGTVENLNVQNFSVSGSNFVGALAGYNYGTISNCVVTSSTVVGVSNVGGIAGEVCQVTGQSGGMIKHSAFSGSVGQSNTTGAGGIAGYVTQGSILTSWANATVTGHEIVGGLVGLMDSTGTGTSQIENSYSLGAVTGASGGQGIAAGLIGEMIGSVLTNSFAAGAVTHTGTLVGGLIGSYDGNGVITSSYWNYQTTGQNTSAGGTSESTAALQNVNTYSGWDFSSVWNPPSGGYPSLR